MASTVPQTRDNSRSLRPIIGRQILDIVTSGMYNNPLMAIREYIQNAADAIDEALGIYSSRNNEYWVKVHVDGMKREISITDNAVGIPRREIEEKLGSIGSSDKEGCGKRGFRGIGRLGGLAYCQLLRFETRSCRYEPVTIVEWKNTSATPTSIESVRKQSLYDAIQSITSIKTRPSSHDDMERFFRVTLVNVHRFHQDVLMNIKYIRNYLSQIAPVEYNPDHRAFRFGDELHEYFQQISNYRTYEIFLNQEPIYKPYGNNIQINSVPYDNIQDIKKIAFHNPETQALIGLGWYAMTSFKSSLPKSVTMRGIRVRHGNIEVGDERFLEESFTEKRFASWHIGEIHLNHSIKPNARRDGFEENQDYERFLERMTVIGKGLSKLCRDSSQKRSANQRLTSEIGKIEQIFSKPLIVFDDSHRNHTIEETSIKLDEMSILAEQFQDDKSITKRLHTIRSKMSKMSSESDCLLNKIDGRKLRHLSHKELVKLICQRIMDHFDRNRSIEEIIASALESLLK
jgi:hypothetical protein